MQAIYNWGPPPDEKAYNMRATAQFAAWERAWAEYVGAEAMSALPGRTASAGPGTGPGQPPMPRYAEVVDYLTTWMGTFEFLQQMKSIVLGKSKYDRLTFGQYEAMLRIIDRANAERGERPQHEGITFAALPMGKYGFAVENEDGALSFFRIDKLDKGNWAGFVFVKHELGGQAEDNMRRVGMVKPGQAYVGQWPDLMRKIEADPLRAAQVYGQALGKCGDCQRTLTNEASREAGIGPVCARKFGA